MQASIVGEKRHSGVMWFEGVTYRYHSYIFLNIYTLKSSDLSDYCSAFYVMLHEWKLHDPIRNIGFALRKKLTVAH